MGGPIPLAGKWFGGLRLIVPEQLLSISQPSGYHFEVKIAVKVQGLEPANLQIPLDPGALYRCRPLLTQAVLPVLCLSLPGTAANDLVGSVSSTSSSSRACLSESPLLAAQSYPSCC